VTVYYRVARVILGLLSICQPNKGAYKICYAMHIKMLHENMHIHYTLQGDDIMVTCNYNTEGRTGMTYVSNHVH